MNTSDPFLDLLDETAHRVQREALKVIHLHTVRPNNMCSCGNPLCLHPGKHTIRNDNRTPRVYSNSAFCGRASLPDPERNLAVSAEGHLILDLDPRWGGAETARRMLHGIDASSTWTVNTAGGGFHFRYKLPEGVTPKSNYIRLGPGVSVLTGATVYGLVPPSRGFDQAFYTWVSPPDAPIAPAPDFLVSLLTEGGAKECSPVHTIMTLKDAARLVHQDFSQILYPVSYDVFEEVWMQVARTLAHQRIDAAGFVQSIRTFCLRNPVTIPEELVAPDVLTTRDLAMQTDGDLTIQGFDSSVEELNRRLARDEPDAARERACKMCLNLVDGDLRLPVAIFALYGSPLTLAAQVVGDRFDSVVADLDSGGPRLARHLKRQYFVHPEELRYRLSHFNGRHLA